MPSSQVCPHSSTTALGVSLSPVALTSVHLSLHGAGACTAGVPPQALGPGPHWMAHEEKAQST